MLTSKRITIKPLEKKHLEKLRLFRNSPDTNYFLTSILPINEAEQEEWFKKISLDSTQMYLEIDKKNGDFIGIIRCDQWDKINRSIRVGIDIIPEERLRGYANETYDLLLNYFFLNLGVHRVWLLVVDYNKPALSLYKKLGFKIEGKQRDAIFRNNTFHDYIMMSILKKEHDKIQETKK